METITISKSTLQLSDCIVLTNKEQRASKPALITLMLLSLASISLPFVALFFLLQQSEDLSLGFFISCIIFMSVFYYFMRMYLWNKYGEEVIIINKDTLIVYYDYKYWSNYLDFNTLEELKKFENQPQIDNKLYNLIKNINLPKIIISTTTNLFIEYELKENIKDFDKIYSCVDTFNTGGKTTEVFKKVCEELNVQPNEILHIGDNKTMDVDNAIEAGVNAIIYDGDIDKLKNEIKKYMEV